MNISRLQTFCQQLTAQPYIEPVLIPPQFNDELEDLSEPNVIPEILKTDVENLINFTQVWTDVLEYEEVQEQFEDAKSSGYQHLSDFVSDHNLVDVGFFYVKVNPDCSVLELLGLMEKIPFEQFRTQGTNTISYANLATLFGDKMEKQTIQLMVLGHHFQYWELINPYKLMGSSPEMTRLVLASMGGLSVEIVPGYLHSCADLVKTAKAQTKPIF